MDDCDTVSMQLVKSAELTETTVNTECGMSHNFTSWSERPYHRHAS